MKKFLALLGIIVVIGLIVLMVGAIAKVRQNQDVKNTASAILAGIKLSLKDGNYVADTAKSELTWTGSKTFILNYEDQGTLKIKTGKISVINGKIMEGLFVIDMTSISASKTGKNGDESTLSKHLKSADFFDVEKYPTADLKLTRVEMDTENKFVVDGELTIKGITNKITFYPAYITQDGDVIIATAKVGLDRTKWDIRYGSEKFFGDLGDKVIDDTFYITLKVSAERTK